MNRKKEYIEKLQALDFQVEKQDRSSVYIVNKQDEYTVQGKWISSRKMVNIIWSRFCLLTITTFPSDLANTLARTNWI